MPPQRRQREYETAVDPDAIHADPEKLTGFGEKREVIKSAELEALRVRAQQAEELREQLNQALAQQGSAGALAVQEDGGLVVQGFRFSPTGLIPSEDVSYEAWEQVGQLLFRLEGSIQWLIGDWLLYGTDLQYGDVKRIAENLGRDEHTLYNYMTVCRAIESSRRRELVPFSHHQDVMSLSAKQQEIALAYAEQHHLNRKSFRVWLKEFKGIPQRPLTSPVMVADDEWGYLRSDIEQLSSNPGFVRSLSPHEKQAMIQRFKKLLRQLEG